MALSAPLTVDDTDYGSFQPELSLRQLFHLQKTPADLRVKLVSAGVDSVDFLANLCETQTAMLEAVKTLLGDESPFEKAVQASSTRQSSSVLGAKRACS